MSTNEIDINAVNRKVTTKHSIKYDALSDGYDRLKRFIFHGKRPQSLFATPRVNPTSLLHPNEKPVALMEWLVEHYCPENGTVLDCFTGVAPVGVACKNLNRNFIGIELDPTYFEIAKKRIYDQD